MMHLNILHKPQSFKMTRYRAGPSNFSFHEDRLPILTRCRNQDQPESSARRGLNQPESTRRRKRRVPLSEDDDDDEERPPPCGQDESQISDDVHSHSDDEEETVPSTTVLGKRSSGGSQLSRVQVPETNPNTRQPVRREVLMIADEMPTEMEGPPPYKRRVHSFHRR